LSDQSRFLSWLNRKGEAATTTEITGTQCPCMISRDASNPSYSAQWHVDHEDAEDCGRTGIIDPNKTTTVTNIKGIFSPPGLVGSSIPGGKEFLESIGEVNRDDLILWGTVDTDTDPLSFKDISGKSEYVFKITKNSIDYTVKDVSWIPKRVGQVARLVRRN